MSARVLVVDDDKQIVRVLQTYLTQEGMTVLTAYDGEEAMGLIRHEHPDCVVLDLMLPGQSGWDVTRLVRSDDQLASTPILMLTARVDDTDKIVGLELGADDYVTKPFNSREVVARVRAILRRTKGASRLSSVLQNRGLRLDSQQRLVTLDGRELELTPTEFALLQTLMENANHVFTRRALIETALGYDYEGLERTVDSHIKNIRKKIEADIANPTYIETVFGMGYRFRTDGETHA
jgi:two-component system alkaline phosphatase synthesis response regulator PhoP